MIAVAAALAAAALLAPASSPGTDDVTLTFDWPLDCAVGVTQTYVGTEFEIDDITVTYDATAEQRDGVVVVEFSGAVVTSAEGIDPSLEPQLAAFFTNPTIEVETDGSPVVAVGFEEWFEQFTASGADGDEAPLEQEVVHRSTSIVWASWVGLWAELESVSGTERFDDVAYLDEYLDEQTAVVDVIADPIDGDTVELVAARAVGGRTTTIAATLDAATLELATASYDVTEGDALLVAYEWQFEWPSDCAGASVADAATASTVAPSNADDGATTPGTVGSSDTSGTSGTSGSSGSSGGSDSEAGGDVVVPPGFDTVTYDELPPEALDTLALIETGGPFPYRQDGGVFGNREGILPDQYDGYYHEYTVETPGSDDRGARRIVTGEGGEVFYTDDHYDSFRVVIR